MAAFFASHDIAVLAEVEKMVINLCPGAVCAKGEIRRLSGGGARATG